MDLTRLAERINSWYLRRHRISAERYAREEPFRAELFRRIFAGSLAVLLIQAVFLLAVGIEFSRFLWTTLEPAALILASSWFAQRRQTLLATLLLLIGLSHAAAFTQARYPDQDMLGAPLALTILVCGLLIGAYFVRHWTLICCLIQVFVLVAGSDRSPFDTVWKTAIAWCAVYGATGCLVALFSRHLERLLLANRTAEEQQRSAIVAERTRVARDIHDTLAQGFTGIMMQLNAAGQRLPSGSELARTHLEKARQLARDSLEEARRSVAALRPGALETGNLLEAIEQIGRQITSDSGIELETHLEGQPYALVEQCESNLLRIAQEALTNTVRHSGAQRAGIMLAYRPGSVVLEVWDDGLGISESKSNGYGVGGMRERVQQIGGQISIQGQPGQGTRVKVTVSNV
jgi:signal transduction histidine kinase